MSDFYVTQMESHTEDSFVVDIIAGAWTIHTEWQWPTWVQEIWDNLTMQITARRDSRPLKSVDGKIVRDYDYFDYWCNYDPEDEVQPYIKMSEYKIDDEVAFAKSTKTWYDTLDEQLYWQVFVDDSTNPVYNMKVEPGGWYNSQNDNYELRFSCTHPRVTKDNLDMVTVIVEDFSNGR